MKFKKLLNVMTMSQPIKIVSTTGAVTKRSPIVRIANKIDRPLIESLEDCKVHSVRHVHDDLEQPENQDYIEVTIIGGNDND